MNKNCLSLLLFSFLTACAGVIDDRHRYTNIYLPGKIGDLWLLQVKQFDQAGKNMGYFYKNSDEDSFVTLVVFIYPVPEKYKSSSPLENELKRIYPGLDQESYTIQQDGLTARGLMVSQNTNRGFAGKGNQTVRDNTYLFTFKNDWFVKIFTSYQADNEYHSKPIIDKYIHEFKWIRPNNDMGIDL